MVEIIQIYSTVVPQNGEPLMIFYTCKANSIKKYKRMVGLVLGVEHGGDWIPTDQSNDVMNRMSQLMSAQMSYTILYFEKNCPNPKDVLIDSMKKTPAGVGMLLCTADVETFKAVYHHLNVQTDHNFIL